jgi:hypothetical protein
VEHRSVATVDASSRPGLVGAEVAVDQVGAVSSPGEALGGGLVQQPRPA